MDSARRYVKVYSTDPVYGDPYEFAFYLTPPYTTDTLKVREGRACVTWAQAMARKGFSQPTTPIQLEGPFEFFQDGRWDLSDNHRGDHEFILKAWFKRERPLEVREGVVEMWRENRRQLGYAVNDPVKSPHDLRPATPFRTENDWVDKDPVMQAQEVSDG